MRIVMENLSKKDLNGQSPVVTLPTKQALNQFESQQKTRPTPPAPPNQKPMGQMMNPGMGPQNMHPRMMNPNPMMRGGGPMQMQNLGPMPGGQRMPGGSGHMNGPLMNNMPPRFQNSWNNGPPRPPPGSNGMGNSRPQMMNQGPLMNMGGMNRPPMGSMGPRPGFVPRPPMHPGYNQGQQNMVGNNNKGLRRSRFLLLKHGVKPYFLFYYKS